jgi:osmotically-inducible protein OsmY
LVTRQEGNRATNLVQGVAGVQRIVKLFEYID